MNTNEAVGVTEQLHFKVTLTYICCSNSEVCGKCRCGVA